MRREAICWIAAAAVAALAGCSDGEPYARAYRIQHRMQAIGGESALADVGDFVLDNDRIRIAVPQVGNSVGPGVFGGSLIDADLQRADPAHRAGRGLDQFTELFAIGNLAIPAACAPDREKVDGFCQFPRQALKPAVRILCDGSRPCTTCYGRDDCERSNGVIDLSAGANLDYADPDDPTRAGPAAPSPEAAVLRVEGMAGNYLEALGLVSLAQVKMSFRIRNDYILEPGSQVVRIRTLLTEADRDGSVLRPEGELVALPSLTRPRALFGMLLGSDFFPTVLDDMTPGVAGGDFLFFGDRLKMFAPGIGFDVYRDIRTKFAVGDDPLNNPLAAPYLAAVGENVSYAIASSDPEGRYLLPILSGAVTAGFTHGAHCHAGPCPGTPEQCANVVDCSQARAYVFERLFAVGRGDVASAAAALQAARGEPLGRLSGRVVDSHSNRPISQAEVHVYPVPATMADCRPGGDPDQPYSGGAAGFARTCLLPREYQGAVSHLRTDPGALDLPAGRFSGRLPAGRYYLLAKVLERSPSRVVAVEVRQDQTSEAVLVLRPPARLRVTVRDGSNDFIPAKLTIGQCLPNCARRLGAACEADGDCESGKCVEVAAGQHRCQVDNCGPGRACDPTTRRCQARGSCDVDEDCEPVERCLAGRCVCQPAYVRKAALGEGTFPPGIGRYSYVPDGRGELAIEPGSWEVWASRGFEYGLDRKQVRAVANRTAELAFRVERQVDTAGWISGDFHVHGQNSYDAVVAHRDRVANFAGEGVEVLSTSDHDYITDLGPTVFDMGMERWVKTQVGLELTTIEIGHWLAFPLRFQQWRDGERLQEQGAVDWTGLFPDQIHAALRDLGRYAPEETVVVVAHPRDSFFGYFDQYGMNPFDPSRIEGTLFEYLPPLHENPLAVPEAFSGTFDALELFNSKRFELIRTPTAGEIRDYNQARAVVQQAAQRGADPLVVERQLIALDREFIRDMLERTPAEQEALWNSDGSAGCDLLTFCSTDTDCDQAAGERCHPVEMFCYVPCDSPADCDGRPCEDGRCDTGLTPAGAPCASHEGIVDDWFRLLDYGVVRTGMGNSDTHKLFSQTEGGLPRNFIRQRAESARAIDLRDMNRTIKRGGLVTSYGPFVEVWLDGQPIGEPPVAAAGRQTVPLRVRVQSPDWFDVDRVEIYRSGRLIHVLTAAGDAVAPDSAVDVAGLRVPNPRIVNLDATLDEPVPETDAWYVVVAMGLDGRDLSPVYTEHPYLKLQIGDVLSRSFGSVPLPFDISIAGIPRVFRILPYAVTNPLFVDVDGNGAYDAPHATPEWAGGAPLSAQQQPLSSARIGGSPLAPATDDADWRGRQLRRFMALLHRALGAGL